MSLLLRFSSTKITGASQEGKNSEISLDVSMIETDSIDTTISEATSCSDGRESRPLIKRLMSQVKTDRMSYRRSEIAV